jgi:predicted glycoside hydrolase/deacetylase ChbG (UPF0249 family)
MNVIFNADDFGYCTAVNLGIADAVKKGVVKSASLMVHQPGTVEAIEIAKNLPQLSLGLHFTLTSGKPTLPADKVSSLVDKEGYFIKDRTLAHAIPWEIEAELISQLECFFSYNIVPTHLDSHHHIHKYHPAVLDTMITLAKTYDLIIRPSDKRTMLRLKKEDIATPDVFIDEFIGEFLIVGKLTSALTPYLHSDLTVEVMCHPGFVDHYLLEKSIYALQRTEEHRILCSRELKSFLHDHHVNITNFNKRNFDDSETADRSKTCVCHI